MCKITVQNKMGMLDFNYKFSWKQKDVKVI